ncbi:nucleotide sugar dehydrogenase [Candidatus Marinimicrobia bacterium]|nr:nucleotide sugar dehydrogenase [Candidatus Neomarinimicrobiota bacterium]
MIKKSEISIAVIGLGYVGLPLAVEFSKKFPVVGYDLNTDRINELKKGKDRTGEINPFELKQMENLLLSSKHSAIKDANTYIITVPTPVDKNKVPNLNPLESASKKIGKYLNKGDVVIYESTVYPGATEEVCVPILEEVSNLVYNKDFYCGYSPERINPGDKKHTLVNIKKVTSGSTQETATFVKELYETIIKAGVFTASSIKVAEAAKVIENTQRDVNIALINELALIFNKLNIDTNEVLEAAGTKWNFLPFKPGLVGGHCIGVDPYYLTHKALEIGYNPEIILAGRRINDSMSKFIVEQTILQLIKKGIDPINAKIGILGLTFKENCPDLRNTKVVDIIEDLNKYKCSIFVADQYASKSEASSLFNIQLYDLEEINDLDTLIIAVPHNSYINFKQKDWDQLLKPGGIIMDVKSIYGSEKFSRRDYIYWSL